MDKLMPIGVIAGTPVPSFRLLFSNIKTRFCLNDCMYAFAFRLFSMCHVLICAYWHFFGC